MMLLDNYLLGSSFHTAVCMSLLDYLARLIGEEKKKKPTRLLSPEINFELANVKPFA